MGDQGTDARFSRGVVLDAGALIAVERGNKDLVALIRGALDLGYPIVIPATVLAQVWRGGPRAARLGRLLDAGDVDVLGAMRAREIGLRLGERDANDVADAHVVCCAAEFRVAVLTSDPGDIQALTRPGEEVAVIAV